MDSGISKVATASAWQRDVSRPDAAGCSDGDASVHSELSKSHSLGSGRIVSNCCMRFPFIVCRYNTSMTLERSLTVGTIFDEDVFAF